MDILLNITGALKLEIFEALRNVKVDELTKDGILEDLQTGDYVINLRKRIIVDLNNLDTPLYRFKILVGEEVEYEFEETDEY